MGGIGTAGRGILGGSALEEEVGDQDVLLEQQEALHWADGVPVTQDLLVSWEGALPDDEDRCLGRNAEEAGVVAEVVLAALEVHLPPAGGGPYVDPFDKFSDQGHDNPPAARGGRLAVP